MTDVLHPAFMVPSSLSVLAPAPIATVVRASSASRDGSFSGIAQRIMLLILRCLNTVDLCTHILPLNRNIRSMSLGDPAQWSYMQLHRARGLTPKEVVDILRRHVCARRRHLLGLSVFSMSVLTSSRVLRAVADLMPRDFRDPIPVAAPAVPGIVAAVSESDDDKETRARPQPPPISVVSVRAVVSDDYPEYEMLRCMTRWPSVFMGAGDPRYPHSGDRSSDDARGTVLRLAVMQMDDHRLLSARRRVARGIVRPDAFEDQPDIELLDDDSLGLDWDVFVRNIRRFALHIGPHAGVRFDRATLDQLASMHNHAPDLFGAPPRHPSTPWRTLNGCVMSTCSRCNDPAIVQQFACSKAGECKTAWCFACVNLRVDPDTQLTNCLACGQCQGCYEDGAPHTTYECELCTDPQPYSCSRCPVPQPSKRVDACILCADAAGGGDAGFVSLCAPCDVKFKALDNKCVDCPAQLHKTCMRKCVCCSLTMCHFCSNGMLDAACARCSRVKEALERVAAENLRLEEEERRRVEEERRVEAEERERKVRAERRRERRRAAAEVRERELQLEREARVRLEREEEEAERKRQEDKCRRNADPFALDNILFGLTCTGLSLLPRPPPPVSPAHSASGAPSPVADAAAKHKLKGDEERKAKLAAEFERKLESKLKRERKVERKTELKAEPKVRGEGKAERKVVARDPKCAATPASGVGGGGGGGGGGDAAAAKPAGSSIGGEQDAARVARKAARKAARATESESDKKERRAQRAARKAERRAEQRRQPEESSGGEASDHSARKQKRRRVGD